MTLRDDVIYFLAAYFFRADGLCTYVYVYYITIFSKHMYGTYYIKGVSQRKRRTKALCVCKTYLITKHAATCPGLYKHNT